MQKEEYPQRHIGLRLSLPQSSAVSPTEKSWPERAACLYFQKPRERHFPASWQQEEPNFWFQFPERREKEGAAFLIPHVTIHEVLPSRLYLTHTL